MNSAVGKPTDRVDGRLKVTGAARYSAEFDSPNLVHAVLVTSTLAFWIVGALLGIFVGPSQAASRSLMAHLAPPEVRTEMFGLYAMTGRITAYVGPFLLGTVTFWTGSQRLGIATILIFFVIGMILLLPVREPADAAQVQ